VGSRIALSKSLQSYIVPTYIEGAAEINVILTYTLLLPDTKLLEQWGRCWLYYLLLFAVANLLQLLLPDFHI
jgi:hypothetical protein